MFQSIAVHLRKSVVKCKILSKKYFWMHETKINISVIAIKREKQIKFVAKREEKRQTAPSKVILCAHSNEPYFVTKWLFSLTELNVTYMYAHVRSRRHWCMVCVGCRCVCACVLCVLCVSSRFFMGIPLRVHNTMASRFCWSWFSTGLFNSTSPHLCLLRRLLLYFIFPI